MLQMAALILSGIIWARLRPGGLGAEQTRRVLTTLVYYLFIPALVLRVMWVTPLGLGSLQIALVGAFSISVSLLLAWLLCRVCSIGRSAMGATLLVAAWPNAIYLGLPILDRLFGDAGHAIAIQFDLFSALPLLLTVGVLIARYYGNATGEPNSLILSVFRVPALWAASLGIMLNLAGLEPPTAIEELLRMLSHAVTPLMLFALGLALVWSHLRSRDWQPLIAVSGIQLIAAPAFALGAVMVLGMQGMVAVGVILETAMPAAVFGLVLCDRYGLDTNLYAAAVTLTTGLSLVSLPLWYALLVILIPV